MGAGDRWFALVLAVSGAALGYGGWATGDWLAMAMGAALLLAAVLAWLVASQRDLPRETRHTARAAQAELIEREAERMSSIESQVNMTGKGKK